MAILTPSSSSYTSSSSSHMSPDTTSDNYYEKELNINPTHTRALPESCQYSITPQFFKAARYQNRKNHDEYPSRFISEEGKSHHRYIAEENSDPGGGSPTPNSPNISRTRYNIIQNESPDHQPAPRDANRTHKIHATTSSSPNPHRNGYPIKDGSSSSSSNALINEQPLVANSNVQPVKVSTRASHDDPTMSNRNSPIETESPCKSPHGCMATKILINGPGLLPKFDPYCCSSIFCDGCPELSVMRCVEQDDLSTPDFIRTSQQHGAAPNSAYINSILRQDTLDDASGNSEEQVRKSTPRISNAMPFQSSAVTPTEEFALSKSLVNLTSKPATPTELGEKSLKPHLVEVWNIIEALDIVDRLLEWLNKLM